MANQNRIGKESYFDGYRERHRELLDKIDGFEIGVTPTDPLILQVKEFTQSLVEVGAVTVDADQRASLQSMIDYWGIKLYRWGADDVAGNQTLLPLDKSKLPDLKNVACPYVGLREFEIDENESFFGRDSVVAKLVERALEDNLLVVTSGTGGGKSSILMAGVIPEILKLDPDSNWTFHKPIRPGVDPQTAIDEVQLIGLKRGNQILFLDQFEEVFSIWSELQPRQELAEVLNQLIENNAGQGRMIILIAMREEFWGKLSDLESLYEKFKDNEFVLRDLSQEQLKSVILKPAQSVGLIFDPKELVDQIVDDVVIQKPSLPTLQLILTNLWKHKDGNLITKEIYDSYFKGKNAIDRIATRNLDQFAADIRSQIPAEDFNRIVKDIFLRLVEPGESFQVSRRRISRSELEENHADPQDQSWREQIIDGLLERDFLRERDDLVEVTHESLLKYWGRLRGWIKSELKEIRFLARISDSNRAWILSGRKRRLLLGGNELDKALQLTDRLSQKENHFVRKSQRTRFWTVLIMSAVLTLLLFAASLFGATYYQLSAIQKAEEEEVKKRGETTQHLLKRAAGYSVPIAANLDRTKNDLAVTGKSIDAENFQVEIWDQKNLENQSRPKPIEFGGRNNSLIEPKGQNNPKNQSRFNSIRFKRTVKGAAISPKSDQVVIWTGTLVQQNSSNEIPEHKIPEQIIAILNRSHEKEPTWTKTEWTKTEICELQKIGRTKDFSKAKFIGAKSRPTPNLALWNQNLLCLFKQRTLNGQLSLSADGHFNFDIELKNFRSFQLDKTTLIIGWGDDEIQYFFGPEKSEVLHCDYDSTIPLVINRLLYSAELRHALVCSSRHPSQVLVCGPLNSPKKAQFVTNVGIDVGQPISEIFLAPEDSQKTTVPTTLVVRTLAGDLSVFELVRENGRVSFKPVLN